MVCRQPHQWWPHKLLLIEGHGAFERRLD